MKNSITNNILYFLFFVFQILFSQENLISKTKLYDINGIKYLSALEYAKTQNIRTLFYDDKEKLELRFQNTKLLLSPHSSFIKVNETTYHMYSAVIYDGNDFYIPVNPFIEILKQSGLPIALIDSSESFVLTTSPLYNINSISISNKINGTVIYINTSKKFSKNMLAASITRGGWLNLTIPGAIVDSLNIIESKLANPIRRVKTIQSNESAQISFLLKTKVDDFEINSDDTFISISIRTALEQNAENLLKQRERWLIDTIVIDAGHGGKDPGAIGVTGLQEKTVNLDITKKLGKLIESNLGIKVIYTRDEDVFIPLWKRTKIANDSGGKIFISIHANASSNPNVRGFETFLLRPGKTQDAIEVAQRENAVVAMEELYHEYEKLSNDKLILYTMAQSAFMEQSEFFAAEIQNELDKVLTSPNRGVKQAGFHVLIGASMPNVLIEAGFLSNKNESKLLGKSSYRQKIAEAIFSSLVNFKDKYENSSIENK
ncbi:MAG: N-acetylmuramoyl-L-alanine amidase [Candidatus Neomarinimicrobiota bacterium]|nr:N-acetylmuramoyl-L-alanine amidase [Candidatus Neomarinimicrobiota bacterium]